MTYVRRARIYPRLLVFGAEFLAAADFLFSFRALVEKRLVLSWQYLHKICISPMNLFQFTETLQIC